MPTIYVYTFHNIPVKNVRATWDPLFGELAMLISFKIESKTFFPDDARGVGRR